MQVVSPIKKMFKIEGKKIVTTKKCAVERMVFHRNKLFDYDFCSISKFKLNSCYGKMIERKWIQKLGKQTN